MLALTVVAIPVLSGCGAFLADQPPHSGAPQPPCELDALDAAISNLASAVPMRTDESASELSE
jgi:hypothetical protein